MRRVGRLVLQRAHDHRFDIIIGDRARRPRPRIIRQPVETTFDEPPAPLDHRGLITPTLSATSLFDNPSAASNTIRARWAIECGAVGRFDQRTSTSRSSSDTVNNALGRPRPATHRSYYELTINASYF